MDGEKPARIVPPRTLALRASLKTAKTLLRRRLKQAEAEALTPEVSLSEAVLSLHDHISKLVRRKPRLTWEEIAEILKQADIKIAARTLRNKWGEENRKRTLAAKERAARKAAKKAPEAE